MPNEEIERALSEGGSAMTAAELAASTGLPEEVVDRALWSDLDRFLWQPGHTWTLGGIKPRPETDVATPKIDVRSKPLQPSRETELRAVTLSNGMQLHVSKGALDSEAPFTVRSAGNIINLRINTEHSLFHELPIPFESTDDSDGYRRLVEVLLSAWSVYEDGIATGPAKRSAQDARHVWGRLTVEMLNTL